MVQNNLLEKILIELDELKQENIELKNENIELKAEIKRLNEIINKDSSNSSKPPSTNDGFKDPKKSSVPSKKVCVNSNLNLPKFNINQTKV